MRKFTVKPNPQEQPVYPHTKADHFIEVLEGPHAGLHFTFGQIEFLGEDADGNGNISYDYDLLFIPEHIDLLEQKDEVEETIGVVLQGILENLLDEESNETGNTDTEQPTEG